MTAGTLTTTALAYTPEDAIDIARRLSESGLPPGVRIAKGYALHRTWTIRHEGPMRRWGVELYLERVS